MDPYCIVMLLTLDDDLEKRFEFVSTCRARLKRSPDSTHVGHKS